MQNALFSYEGQYFLIDEDNCLDCGSCVEFCQEKAILLKGVGQPVLDAEIDAIKELVYQELVRA
jgi:ferredoxin